ncbi:MAG TPA: SDR family oxidoreductase [Candidatus Acidoferrales bacterium]|nr:SDR family oxidoreductase [Candidatus Acidoferrales bacterium]
MADNGRVALISGAARGLARGIATNLAQGGYRVAFTYRPGGTPPAQTEQAVRAMGGAVFSVAADARIAGETLRAVREVEHHFGRIDVLVHAVGPIVVKRFARLTMDDTREMIDANFSSAVEAAFAVLPGMRERGFGRLVYFGMNGSQTTIPARGMTLYGAAKAAVVSFARSLALEEAKAGITVNVIEPGDIREKELSRADARTVPAKNPTGHAGSWEDIAYAVRFLVADEASFINGVCVGVNGGLAEPHE